MSRVVDGRYVHRVQSENPIRFKDCIFMDIQTKALLKKLGLVAIAGVIGLSIWGMGYSFGMKYGMQYQRRSDLDEFNRTGELNRRYIE